MYQAAIWAHCLTIFEMVVVRHEMELFPNSMNSAICVGELREKRPRELA